jgi:Flp pilus assembly protein TadD
LLPAAALVLAAAPYAQAQSAADPRRRCLESRRDEAVQACRQALQAGPAARASALLRQALVDALVETGRFTEAVDVLREAARTNEADAQVQRRLGSALLHFAGNASDAVPVLQAALRLEPSDAHAYGELGVALHRLGQHPEAVAAFTEAGRLEPSYFEDRPAARAARDAARRGESWP